MPKAKLFRTRLQASLTRSARRMRTRILLRKTSSSQSTTNIKNRQPQGLFVLELTKIQQVAGALSKAKLFRARLQASLTRLLRNKRTRILLRKTSSSRSTTNIKNRQPQGLPIFYGRSGGTRTRGLQYPKRLGAVF